MKKDLRQEELFMQYRFSLLFKERGDKHEISSRLLRYSLPSRLSQYKKSKRWQRGRYAVSSDPAYEYILRKKALPALMAAFVADSTHGRYQ